MTRIRGCLMTGGFRESMDRLCLTASEAGELFSASVQHVRQMRLPPENPGHRPPPDGWRPTFARMARQRGGELLRLADELEG
jgi:hypothetical protein